MTQQQLTPINKAKTEERNRRERQRDEGEYRRRIERLRRQIEDARKRRKRMLLLFLLAVLAMLESILAAFQRSFTYRPEPAPEHWTPLPENDFAPRTGHDDHCDGYSREQWNLMLNERGIRISRKGEIKAAWEADPERELFPERYQLWDSKPHLGQIIYELTTPYWQQDAFIALKLLSPIGTHKYLEEAYATDPGVLRQCLADRDSDILHAFQTRAILWEERKRREAEKAKREQELSRKEVGDQGIPKPN